MSSPDPSPRNRPNFFGSALAGSCIAVVASVPISAFCAASLGDNYQTRAFIYCGFLLWVVVGATSVFLKTWKAEQERLSITRIFLWFASVWLWPLLCLPCLFKKNISK